MKFRYAADHVRNHLTAITFCGAAKFRDVPEADMLRFIRQGSLRDTGDTEWLRRDIAMKQRRVLSFR
jgi:hypothetical protein